MRGKITFFLFLSLAVFFMPSLAEAQQDYRSLGRFEISTALSYNHSFLDTSYYHSYSPPYEPYPYVSNAQQTVNIEGDISWGFSAAFNYFPAENFGLQFLAEFLKPPLSGGNSSYDIDLLFFTSQAPGSLPSAYERSYDWRATQGTLSQYCLNLNGVGRLPIGSVFILELSGGISYHSFKGEAVSLGYSTYWLGAQSVLLGETYQLRYTFGREYKWGLNGGAELGFLIYSNIVITLDVRYFYCAEVSLPIQVQDDGLTSDPIEVVRTNMNLGEISVNPSFLRLNVGVKFLF